jgi:RNA 3'-terminal phosphate cyclase
MMEREGGACIVGVILHSYLPRGNAVIKVQVDQLAERKKVRRTDNEKVQLRNLQRKNKTARNLLGKKLIRGIGKKFL